MSCPICKANEIDFIGFLGDIAHLNCRACGVHFHEDKDDFMDEYDPSDDWDCDMGMSDVEADADVLRMCGWGTEEDYGYYGDSWGEDW